MTVPIRLARCSVCSVVFETFDDDTPRGGVLRMKAHGESAEQRCDGSEREVGLEATWLEGDIAEGRGTVDAARLGICAWCKRRRRAPADDLCAECRAERTEAEREPAGQEQVP